MLAPQSVAFRKCPPPPGQLATAALSCLPCQCLLAPCGLTRRAPTPPPRPQAKFYNGLKSLQTKQLGAVLTYLAPANALPIFSINVKATTTNDAPTTRAPNTRPNLANPTGRGSGSGSGR